MIVPQLHSQETVKQGTCACEWLWPASLSRPSCNYFRGLTRKKRNPFSYILFRVNENKCNIPLCYHLQFSGFFFGFFFFNAL